MVMVTSLIGSYSGHVSYNDGTDGSFHVQMETTDENQLYWTFDEILSRLTLVEMDRDCRVGRACTYNLAFSGTLEQAPWISSVTWGITPWMGTPKQITDAVLHFKILATFDDQREQYPLSATFE